MFKQLRLLIVFSFLMIGLVQPSEPGHSAFALPATPPSIESHQQPVSASWYDGLFQYSTITNCYSIIQGLPYQENGVGTFVGFLADTTGGQPVPNQSYYIHVVIAGLGNSCGTTIYGADQTFRTLPDGQVTVGNGTSASCTPAAFTTALNTAKELRFECGSQPVTITLSSAQSITSNVTIIGGNMVTLDMANSNRHFTVQTGNTLTLTQIALINGNAPLYSCGGAVYVAVNARLVLNETRFIGNHSGYQGGALCINGAASITTTLFISNTAGSHGGAIGNYGTTSIGYSKFTGNTAGINGGAIDTTVNLIVDTTTFISNTAIYRGGGINNYLGVMSINNSTFTNNSANGYGGGASNDAGNAAINGSTFNANVSYNGGGLQNSGTLNLINTTLSANRALASGANITATGGGLYWVGGSVSVLNTTLVSNTATMAGGNLFAGGGLANTAITLKNTLIAFGSPDNCDTSIFSHGHNLESADTCGLIGNGDKINLNPKVGPLRNNGGPTWTHALDVHSPARDAATNIGCPLTDQRGVSRSQGATCDIGAYEGTPVRWMYLPLIRR